MFINLYKKPGLLFIICVLVSGSAWIFVPPIISNQSIESFLFHRLTLSGIIMIVLTKIYEKSISINLSFIISSFFNGIFSFGINYIFATYAAKLLPTGLIVATFSLICFPNMLLGYIFLKKPANLTEVMGALVMSFGIYILYIPASYGQIIQSDNYQLFMGLFLCIFACAMFSIANIITAKDIKYPTTIINSY